MAAARSSDRRASTDAHVCTTVLVVGVLLFCWTSHRYPAVFHPEISYAYGEAKRAYELTWAQRRAMPLSHAAERYAWTYSVLVVVGSPLLWIALSVCARFVSRSLAFVVAIGFPLGLFALSAWWWLVLWPMQYAT